MADDAASGGPAPAGAPAYANDPTDSTTWSPDFAAKVQAAVAQRQADQLTATNAATLAVLQPCAFLLDAAATSQIAALKALAKAVDTGEETQADQMFVAQLRNAAASLGLAAQSYATRYAAAGGKPPTG